MDKEVMMTIVQCDELKALRKRLGFTAQQVADLVKISKTIVINYENHKPTRYVYYVAIKHALHDIICDNDLPYDIY